MVCRTSWMFFVLIGCNAAGQEYFRSCASGHFAPTPPAPVVTVTSGTVAGSPLEGTATAGQLVDPVQPAHRLHVVSAASSVAAEPEGEPNSSAASPSVNIIRREYPASYSSASEPDPSATPAPLQVPPPPTPGATASASATPSEPPPPDLGPAGLGDTADYTDRSSYFAYPGYTQPLPPPTRSEPGPSLRGYTSPPLAPPGAGVYPGGRYPVGR